MSLLYYDPAFLQHTTGDLPECADRIVPAARRLNLLAMQLGCVRPSWLPLTPEQLALVHSPEYIEKVRDFAARGGGAFAEDTVVSADSFAVASLASGAVVDAVGRVLVGPDKHAFCLIRPPGHHATRDKAMGFCLFNHVALGARTAIESHGLSRVLIIDWDVHHGNGTQDIFWEDDQVGYFSIHRDPFYPDTGAADEIGAGPGRGTVVNVPIAFGTSREEYLDRFRFGVEKMADQMRPELIIISAGFDAHRLDPIGSLGLETEDFGTMTRVVLEIAKVHAAGRIVSVLEGGYHPHALAECVETHVHELMF